MPSYIPFDTFTLAAVAAELRRALAHARVQKVQQPSAHDLVLALYGRSGAQRLLLSADPQRFRVHLTQTRRENPVTAPGFCQNCRKHLEGAILESVTMPRFDRVLHLHFRAHDNEKLLLVAELMGRNSNLVLVSGAGNVRAAIRPNPSGERPLRPGSVYADPPGYSEKTDAFTVTDAPPVENVAEVTSAFSGIGRFAEGEIAARAAAEGITPGEAFARLMDEVREERFDSHSIADGESATIGVWAFVPLSVPAGRRFQRESVSVALDTFHATLSERTTEEGEKAAISRALEREMAYRRKEIASAQKTQAEAGRAEEYERMGNLLLANLTLVERGASAAVVPDLYAEEANATVNVTLDPKKSPQENAQSYFDRARKARDAADYAEGREVDLTDELAALESLSEQLARAEDSGDFEGIRRALTEIVGAERAAAAAAGGAKKAAEKPKEKPFAGHRIRTYDVEGFTLLVGETAEANDYLTTRVAAPTDYWMHVRAAAGAHGVLRTHGQPERIPETVLRRAAEIVAARSGTAVKHSGLVTVDVVPKRYVRKPRGAKPGLVTYERERSLDISPKL